MIRVTLSNKEVIESKTLRNRGWYISLDKADYRKTEIVKVEKQVKDLTNEEELKLKLLAKTFIYDGTKYRVKYTMNNPRRYPEYYLDDYIDITQLVKMNKYCGKNYTNVYGDEMEELEGVKDEA